LEQILISETRADLSQSEFRDVISTFWIFCAIDYDGLREDDLGGCPAAVKGFLELVLSREKQITFDVDVNSLTQI
jgi:hypothetical protein